MDMGPADPGIVANERLTALASGALLALLVVVLATTPRLGPLILVHVFVGVLLVGPLAVKLASTGYRFLRYYSGTPAYVRRGPPRRGLRWIAPALVVMTLVLVVTGIALLVTGPDDPGPFVGLHNLSFVVWLPLAAVHVFGHLRGLAQVIADEWRDRRSPPARPGRVVRLDLTAGALLFGAIAAGLALPGADPWAAPGILTQTIPGPVVASALVTIITLVAVRPHRWT